MPRSGCTAHRRDYTSNFARAHVPRRLDVEEVASARPGSRAPKPCGRTSEHVTLFLYHRPDRFASPSSRPTEQLGHERWTLDTAEDLACLRTIVAALDDPVAAGWHDASPSPACGRLPRQLTLAPTSASSTTASTASSPTAEPTPRSPT